MRKINFLTWNTQLYEMGNRLSGKQPVKEIDNQTFETVINKIKEFLDSKNEANEIVEAVAILQEIPFKCNVTWEDHPLFSKFSESFPAGEYVMLYNISSERQIKMTVALSKKH